MIKSNQSRVAVIEEQFIQSRTGREEDNEDLIYTSEHFIAVVDGATSKTGKKWHGETGGKIAARLIKDALESMPRALSAGQAVDRMNEMFVDFYRRNDLLAAATHDPGYRIAAALAGVNLFRQEVWLIGDCQVMLGDQHLSTRLKSDLVLSEVRALALEMELLKGTTIDDLRKVDAGRALIMPLLRGQAWFQNNLLSGEYFYAAIDGFPIPEEGIIIEKISPDVDCIILATDGYPQLCSSLEASERVLQEILSRDPLVFRIHKTTKGMMHGNISYDDRAYVKIKLQFRCLHDKQ